MWKRKKNGQGGAPAKRSKNVQSKPYDRNSFNSKVKRIILKNTETKRCFQTIGATNLTSWRPFRTVQMADVLNLGYGTNALTRLGDDIMCVKCGIRGMITKKGYYDEAVIPNGVARFRVLLVEGDKDAFVITATSIAYPAPFFLNNGVTIDGKVLSAVGVIDQQKFRVLYDKIHAYTPEMSYAATDGAAVNGQYAHGGNIIIDAVVPYNKKVTYQHGLGTPQRSVCALIISLNSGGEAEGFATDYVWQGYTYNEFKDI